MPATRHPQGQPNERYDKTKKMNVRFVSSTSLTLTIHFDDSNKSLQLPPFPYWTYSSSWAHSKTQVSGSAPRTLFPSALTSRRTGHRSCRGNLPLLMSRAVAVRSRRRGPDHSSTMQTVWSALVLSSAIPLPRKQSEFLRLAHLQSSDFGVVNMGRHLHSHFHCVVFLCANKEILRAFTVVLALGDCALT